jgi:predicted transposase/invertase (TIGR01784 family)
MNLFPLTNDLVFKSVFCSDTNLLISLLNSILFTEASQMIQEICIMNPEIPTAFSKDKRSVLDIRAVDRKGRQFQVEVQVGYQGVYIKRALYYISGLIRDQLKEKGRYSDLKAVYQVNILNFELLPGTHYINRFKFREERNPELTLTEELEIVFLELPKFQKKDIVKGENILDLWMHLLKNIDKMEESEVAQVVDQAPDLANAFKILEYYSSNPAERKRIEDRIKSDRDYAYDLASNYERGERKGKLEGKQEGKLEDARLMKLKGYPISDIREITKLTEDQLRENGILDS